MRCERCGGPIGNKLIRFNGRTICENCARDLKVDRMFRSPTDLFGESFPILGELTNAILGGGADLEFSNTKIRCPRCMTTLRDIEKTGKIGCIECYNTFNETILKDVLRRQGTGEYKGRKPGEEIDIGEDTDTAAGAGVADAQKETSSADKKPADGAAKKAPSGASKKNEDMLERIKKSDIGMLSDEELEKAMKEAAAKEDYDLAIRLRDEIKSRKEGN